MGTIMEMDDQLESWLADNIPPEMLSTPLSDAVAGRVVDGLKREADRYWSIDANYSLKYARRILAIGRARGDMSQMALGLMAQGDALKLLGYMQEAWDMLGQAGEMFESIGDEFGWARTRIGRLYLSPQLNCLAVALADAERARTIFTQYGDRERLLRLDLQTGLVCNYLGDQQRALELLGSAFLTAELLGEVGQDYLGQLHENIGLTYSAMGNFYPALTHYEKARELGVARSETLSIARIEASVAEIAQAQGHYRRALALLNGALEKVSGEAPFDVAMIKYHMVECYLSLNRYPEARELAQQVIKDCRNFNASYELARTLLFLATVEAKLGNFVEAETALAEAEPIFTSRGATNWIATICLWRGRLALKQGDPVTAYRESTFATSSFEADDQQLNNGLANLLQGQALFALEDYLASEVAGRKTLQIAQSFSIPSLRYEAYLLLGKIAEVERKYTRANHRYKAAAATIERVQHGLTITLRPGFLEDKGEALRRLIALQLRLGDSGAAFETLERAKSQVWLGYLINREQLRWSRDDASSRTLIDELERLRTEHQSFYRLAHELPRDTEHPKIFRIDQISDEVMIRERRMRAITEQLYLRNGTDHETMKTLGVSSKDIQERLGTETLLIEYYNDGEQLWAFTLDRETVVAHRLSLTVGILNQLTRQLQANLAAALKSNSESDSALRYTDLAQRILQRLHSLLIAPLMLQQNPWQRLVIVPYGALHFLPFHLLYDGSKYLIERYEIVTLPAAGLMTRSTPKRIPGALILAHSWDGRLPYTHKEAAIVQRLFGGELYTDEAASRSALQAQPMQVLHIAAHGQHRLDQPDLSYLQLADGQLYADDVLQQDLSYELVTLSACETGRANVAADEELIGIGRGFLYAGAGALILSLWGVSDRSTASLMEKVYGSLRVGTSKAAALREAQRSILAENRNLHPAFWGAFQLIGDAGPLSR